jgi:hypothetical protein
MDISGLVAVVGRTVLIAVRAGRSVCSLCPPGGACVGVFVTEIGQAVMSARGATAFADLAVCSLGTAFGIGIAV